MEAVKEFVQSHLPGHKDKEEEDSKREQRDQEPRNVEAAKEVDQTHLPGQQDK